MNIRSKIFGGESAVEPSPLVESKKPKGAKADTLHSIPVAREAKRCANTRDEDRHRLVDEKVQITHNGTTCDVTLVNLSGGGAMVSGDFEPVLWDRVDLHLGENGTVECAVRWIRDDRVGLEFAHETRLDCSVDEQAVLLREVIVRSFPDVEFEAETHAVPEAAAEELRAARRHPLIWSGVLHHDYQSTPVRLRNVSSTGAMIECGVPPHVGAEPLLDLGESGSVFATVAWVVGDQVGLRFHAPFDMTLLSRSRPQIAPARWERPAYLQPTLSADSPWDEKWGRLSVGELRDELEGFLKR